MKNKLIPHKFVPHIWTLRNIKTKAFVQIDGARCVKCESYVYKNLANVIKDLKRLNLKDSHPSKISAGKQIHHVDIHGKILKKESCIISDEDFIVQEILT